ncbi:MAG: stage III sporulation protein AB [Christensenellales bacterium]|jgi:stage III sporulation protein AB
MKLVMILVLVVACTYVGRGFSNHYVLRHSFFNELLMFFNKLNLDINFSREKLKPIIASYTSQSKELSIILKNFLEAIEEKKVDENKLFSGTRLLTQDEKNTLLAFFSSLGRFDLLGQTNQINNFVKQFETTIKQTSADKEKYGTLFTKLGLIIGVVISLILL